MANAESAYYGTQDAQPSGGGGNLAQVVGFVTEFNQNVQIFSILAGVLVGALEEVKELQALAVGGALYTLQMLDPETYAEVVATSTADFQGVYDPNKEELYDTTFDDAKQQAQAVSPIVQLSDRLTELESVLGVGQTTDDETKPPQNALATLEAQQHTLSLDLALLKSADIGLQNDITDTRQLAYDAKRIAGDALATARNHRCPPSKDPLHQPAEHNQGGSEVTNGRTRSN
jgi:hypothetical protein